MWSEMRGFQHQAAQAQFMLFAPPPHFLQALTQPSFHVLSTIQFSKQKPSPIPNHQSCSDPWPVCINRFTLTIFLLKNTVKVLENVFFTSILCFVCSLEEYKD